MRLNEWQPCANVNSSSDAVTSSDDFARLYGFEDDSPNSSLSAGGDGDEWRHDIGDQTTYASRTKPNNGVKTSNPSQSGNKKKGGRNRPSNYKHVPHREKPPHLVARRNARERRRVQAVNTAFARLRKCVPLENRNKRLSKVKTLQRAIEYINNLQDLLDDYEAIGSSNSLTLTSSVGGSLPAGFVSQQNLASSVLVNSSGQRSSPVASSSTVNVNKNFNHHQLPFENSSLVMDHLDDFTDAASVVDKENQGNQRWLSLENSVIPDNFGSFIPFYDDFNPAGPLHA